MGRSFGRGGRRRSFVVDGCSHLLGSVGWAAAAAAKSGDLMVPFLPSFLPSVGRLPARARARPFLLPFLLPVPRSVAINELTACCTHARARSRTTNHRRVLRRRQDTMYLRHIT